MRTVLFLEEAVQEGEEAAGWYEAQREGPGREFREAFSRSLEMLREGLLTGSPWPGLRRPGGASGAFRWADFLIMSPSWSAPPASPCLPPAQASGLLA